MSSLDNLRKTARRWLKALREGDADARARLVRAYPGAPEQPALRDVQHALAREHDIWALCFNGCVDRVRTILADDPGLARAVSAEGITPLWWLPDDEALAMQIVELLIAAGADPARKSRDGRTAADRARRRGMRDVVARLETAMAERASE